MLWTKYISALEPTSWWNAWRIYGVSEWRTWGLKVQCSWQPSTAQMASVGSACTDYNISALGGLQ